MKIRIAAIVFSLAFILQGTLLNLFTVYNATPNLMLCLVIAFAFLYEDEKGIYLGMIFGMLSDCCFSDVMGIASLGYLLVWFVIVKVRRFLNKENILTPIIYITAGTFLYNLFYWIATSLFREEIALASFLKIQPAFILYNLLVMILLYLFLLNKVVRHRSDRYYT